MRHCDDASADYDRNGYVSNIPCHLQAQHERHWMETQWKKLTPGFLGTPAGITTTSAPVRASFSPLKGSSFDSFESFGGGRNPWTLEGVAMWERSTATPGALTIS